MTPRIKAITVDIMEKDYSVACPQGEEKTLHEAVDMVNQVMQRIKRAGRTVGMERIAVMAALNMAHELLSYKQRHAADETPNAVSSELKALAKEEADIAAQLQALTQQVQEALSSQPQGKPSIAPEKTEF